MDILDLVNLSVNQTILRSVITHLTTLLVLTALFIFGGSTVHSFSGALIVGVIVDNQGNREAVHTADRQSTRLNSSHQYALRLKSSALKKKKTRQHSQH